MIGDAMTQIAKEHLKDQIEGDITPETLRKIGVTFVEQTESSSNSFVTNCWLEKDGKIIGRKYRHEISLKGAE